MKCEFDEECPSVHLCHVHTADRLMAKISTLEKLGNRMAEEIAFGNAEQIDNAACEWDDFVNASEDEQPR